MTALPDGRPPPRYVLRLAGVLTQLVSAVCLLLGTIAFVLIHQHGIGGAGLAIAWAVAAMAGLVCGGRMVHGGLVSVLASATLVVSFGLVLVVLDDATLRSLLRVLPPADIDRIATALVGVAIAAGGTGALCLAAIPQARWPATEAPATIVPTAKGWTPHPAHSGHTTMVIVRPSTVGHRRARWPIYFALGGLAMGVGATVGLFVAAGARPGPASPTPGGAGGPVAAPPDRVGVDGSAAASAHAAPAPRADEGAPGAVPADAAPAAPIRDFVEAQRAAIARGDAAALAATVAPHAFAFGLDAGDVVEGRAAIEAMLASHLGDAPPEGFTIASRFLATGVEHDHAWTAEELELSLPGGGPRRIAITQLVAYQNGAWTVVALHWGHVIPDPVAERRAILGTLPSPGIVPGHVHGPADLADAVRAAFSSRAAFIAARSDRPDAFNFGSGPGERVRGGAAIRRVFGNLRADLRARDGIRMVTADAWDASQRGAPSIAYAALDVDFTTRTRAATDLRFTFRVLAVLVREGPDWRIVQTHWSHAGPVP